MEIVTAAADDETKQPEDNALSSDEDGEDLNLGGISSFHADDDVAMWEGLALTMWEDTSGDISAEFESSLASAADMISSSPRDDSHLLIPSLKTGAVHVKEEEGTSPLEEEYGNFDTMGANWAMAAMAVKQEENAGRRAGGSSKLPIAIGLGAV